MRRSHKQKVEARKWKRVRRMANREFWRIIDAAMFFGSPEAMKAVCGHTTDRGILNILRDKEVDAWKSETQSGTCGSR